jgi:UDP-N-acetylglucosamine 2-epimerase (non-hydrolysing)
LPKPDIDLGVGSGSHGSQTGKIMIEFEKIVTELKPDMVLVVGDVNSTIACGLVAVKLGIKLAHVEAGLRSFDRTMPEEINRVLTDQISDLLFTTERSAQDNLEREGIDPAKIHFVGNVMIDTLLKHRERAEQSTILDQLHLHSKKFGLITLHRPSNVDVRENFAEIFAALIEIQRELPLVFPMHPRTRKQMQAFQLEALLAEASNLVITEPLGYLDFLKLTSHARLVVTDSGGIQEETTVVHVPCITVRENTERPVTVTSGTNVVVGVSRQRILEESRRILHGDWKNGRVPELWDGKAARRIVERLISS